TPTPYRRRPDTFRRHLKADFREVPPLSRCIARQTMRQGTSIGRQHVLGLAISAGTEPCQVAHAMNILSRRPQKVDTVLAARVEPSTLNVTYRTCLQERVRRASVSA